MKTTAFGESVHGAEGGRAVAVSLPAQNGTRWRARHKAEVVRAVFEGVLSFDQARERYALSMEEFLSWQELVARQSFKARRPASRTAGRHDREQCAVGAPAI